MDENAKLLEHHGFMDDYIITVWFYGENRTIVPFHEFHTMNTVTGKDASDYMIEMMKYRLINEIERLVYTNKLKDEIHITVKRRYEK